MRKKVIVNWWTAGQAAKRCCLSVGMVGYLARHEIVVPSGPRKGGRGYRRLYSYSDLVILRAVGRLLEQGVEVRRLQKDLARLHARYRKQKSEAPDLRYLVTDGRFAYLWGSTKLLERLDSGQAAFQFVLDMDALCKDIGSTDRGISEPGRTTPVELKSNRRKGLPLNNDTKTASAPRGRR